MQMILIVEDIQNTSTYKFKEYTWNIVNKKDLLKWWFIRGFSSFLGFLFTNFYRIHSGNINIYFWGCLAEKGM